MAASAAAAQAARHRQQQAARQEANDGDINPSQEALGLAGQPVKKPKKPKKPKLDPVLPRQKEVFEFYASQRIQVGVAVLIVCNFVFSIAEKEYDPYPKDLKLYPTLWKVGNAIFNFIFLIELAVNFYGNVYWKSFFRGGWNIFDSLIVLLGTISLFETFLDTTILPPTLSLLRPFRAFRVFRLFKRVPSLNKIMVSLAKAVPGVANAFLIMVIIMCIYAILAVEFFAGFGSDSTYTTFQEHGKRGIDAVWSTDENGVVWENATVTAITPRGFTYGEEYYGTFARSMYTLFQVLTGESWSEAVARPTMFGQDNGGLLSGLFYVTFIIIMQIVMLNVVVAVLLEKMVEEPTPEEEDSDDEASRPPSGLSDGTPASLPTPARTPSVETGGLQRTGSPDTGDAAGKGQFRAITAGSTSPPFGGRRSPANEKEMQAMQAQINYMQAQLTAICAALNVPEEKVAASVVAPVVAPNPSRRPSKNGDSTLFA